MSSEERSTEHDDRDEAIGEAGPSGGGYNNAGAATVEAPETSAPGTPDAPRRTPSGHVSGAQDEGSLEADRKGD